MERGLHSQALAVGARCARVCALSELWKNFLFYVELLALLALGNLDTSFLSSYLSALVRCLGVACGVQRSGFFGRFCVLATWFDSGYMFLERLWTNFLPFPRCGELEPRGVSLPFNQNGECAQSMRLVLVALSAVRSLTLDIISRALQMAVGGFLAAFLQTTHNNTQQQHTTTTQQEHTTNNTTRTHNQQHNKKHTTKNTTTTQQQHNNNNNNNNTIWGGSVLTGEEPPPHSGELKHALHQAGGPTQSQLSRPMSSGHHISMERRLRRKQLNSDTNASNKTYLKEIQEKRIEENFSSEKMNKENEKT